MTKRALQFAAFREQRHVIGGGAFLRIIHRAWRSHQPAKRVRANLSVIVPTRMLIGWFEGAITHTNFRVLRIWNLPISDWNRRVS